MKFSKRSILAGWLLIAGLCGGITRGETFRLQFDSDAPGSAPAFVHFESSDGLPAPRWLVEPSENPMSTPNVLIQTDGSGKPGQFRFALSTEAKRFEQGSVQAAVQCRTKGNPCRAGVVFRYRDPENFVAAVYDFAKSTVTLFERRKGKSELLGSAPFESLERFWTTVALAGKGGGLSVSVSGRNVLKAHDPHPHDGEVGLISESGSLQAFDELVISSP